MKLVTVFEYAELKALQSGVMIEMWNHVMSTGSGKRKFNAAFTEKEQTIIKEYYIIFYTWHVKKREGTGIPKTHQMKISTYQLMERAIKFFGGF